MADLLDLPDEPTRLALDIKNVTNADMEHARSVDRRVVQEAILVADAEAIPPPAVPGFKAHELPLMFSN
jgi:hypothetical protein